eukprot:TRINITY_DN31483_c0_g1_i1.p1 TRINITY_DN31483_c0_g1~~TRINITY_DN31483_c0_g1_i1.p1  ORF type:complete len:101 (-),score=15.12 TRINITY_DN31483_c0_g1_i1:877-1179(-)
MTNVNSAFQGQDFSLQNTELGMKWKHGDVPTQSFKYKVFIEHLSICHMEFEVTAFKAHLVEKLSDPQDENNQEFRRQVNKCALAVIDYNKGPANTEALQN